jgi:hypothetical protein
VRRRVTVSRKPAKPQLRKRTRPKRSNAPTAARHRSPSVIELQEQLDARTRQLNEAIEREQATAEVLRVISNSPGELTPVFEAMLASAVRLCEARFGILYLREGNAFRMVAAHRVPSKFAVAHRSSPFHPIPGAPLGDVLELSRQSKSPTLQRHDLTSNTIRRLWPPSNLEVRGL